ncbi:unnamed protein product [Caenorhabditis sp. 36 PRJEB53466]|nr:unnamed protein product [Caenorhabditis sp. 36 PRJEB53466]
MYLCGKNYEQEMDLIRREYLNYEQGFLSLTNFALYELDTYWVAVTIITMIGSSFTISVYAFTTKGMFDTLLKLRSKTSAVNYKKQRMALISLIAQLATSIIVIIPPGLLALLIIIKFTYAQKITRWLLVAFTSHASINVIVLIITSPPFRKFTFFWRNRKTTPLVVSKS